MNIHPVSFGMAAIFTDKGVQQFVKASTNSKQERSDNFVRSADQFHQTLANTQHVDVIVDKTGIAFPRLKAQVVKKDSPKKVVLSTVKQPRFNKTSTKIFDVSTEQARNAENVLSLTQNFDVR